MLDRRYRLFHRAKQAGLSLVELLVGVAVGLFVVAGAATVVSTQLVDSRRLTMEAQLQQDLRATADIMTRQIRRAGYWSASQSLVWSPSGAFALNSAVALSNTASEVTLSQSGSTVTGFKLNTVGSSPAIGVIAQKYGTNPSQELTDKSLVNITALNFSLTPMTATPGAAPIQLSCAVPCSGGGNACWPTMQPMELNITITGQLIANPQVQRTVQSTVRVRNDPIVNNNGTGFSGPLCPT